MIETIREAECQFFNTVSLKDLLRQVDQRFRAAVLETLRLDGFELDEASPCLQHPREVLEAIDGLENLGFGLPWESFQQALLAAWKAGILLDLGNRDSAGLSSVTAIHSGWVSGTPRLDVEPVCS